MATALSTPPFGIRRRGDEALLRSTVAGAMLTIPKTCPPDTTVAAAAAAFLDDHVHALLVVADRRLLAVVERRDLGCVPADVPVRRIGRLGDRVVDVDADLAATRRAMYADGRRRLAVVDDAGTLVGLLCRKRSGRGFCSDANVLARACGPHHQATPVAGCSAHLGATRS